MKPALQLAPLILTGGLLPLVLSSPCRAAVNEDASRPRVGLVLAGGGAKGGAHVGVLKELERQRIPVDCIAGTSMGALIGGGYASGIPAAELEKFLIGVNWKKVVGSQGRRDLEPVEQKRAGVTYSNSLEFGITPTGITTPGGLIDTSNVEDLLRTYVASARLETDFDKLPIPYRAVATDMVSANMVVLDHGDLATAMRASMSIPGAFAPVLVGNQILSDGGLVRNIPIDIARNLCADVVIVVNLVEPAADPARLQSATQLLSRTMDVMIIANEELQLATLQPGDVRIDVEMGSITTADFERVPETVPLGEAAARKMSSESSKYSVPDGAVSRLAYGRHTITADRDAVLRRALRRAQTRQSRVPRNHDRVKAGDVVDTEAISQQAQRMSALQDFDSVGYRLDGDRSRPYSRGYRTKRAGDPTIWRWISGPMPRRTATCLNLYGRHVRTWVNSLGAEWRNELQLGSETLLATSLFQPLDVAHRFFVEPRALYSRSVEDLFVDDERVARYTFQDVAAAGCRRQLRVATRRPGSDMCMTQRKVSVDIGSELLPNGKPVDAGIRFPPIRQPRHGIQSDARIGAGARVHAQRRRRLGADRNWDRAELGVGMAVPLRNDVLWVTLAGGSDLGSDLPADRTFAARRARQFSGLGTRRAARGWLLDRRHQLPVEGQGRAADPQSRALRRRPARRLARSTIASTMATDGDIYGGSVFLTGRTMVGPLTVGIGATSSDSWSLWFSVGRPIGHGTILEKGIFR